MFKVILSILILLFITTGDWYAWAAFPIISGYAAKNLCSAVYLQHRDPAKVIKDDLGDFPLLPGNFKVDSTD